MTTGIKVSLPGYDVRTCSAKECSLHSEYSALKSRLIGVVDIQANQLTQIKHDFGYEPAYCGWLTGNLAILNGTVPFGGVQEQNTMLESYTTTDSLYLKCNHNCTAYYYIFADLAGKETNKIAYDNYGSQGLIISKPGINVLSALPHQLNFCSKYPNFKIYSEYARDGTVIIRGLTPEGIGENDTTIKFDGANHYGDCGEFIICGYETVVEQQWGWCLAESSPGDIGEETYVNSLAMIVHAEGIEFRGTWTDGEGCRGDVKFEGDNGERRFYYKKGDNWNRIGDDTGWQNSYYNSWGRTWHKGDDWLEIYEEGWGYSHICWHKTGQYSYPVFRSEKVRFHESSSTHFHQCERGIDNTQKRGWWAGCFIVPLTLCFQITNNPFLYTPAFMGWTIGAFEANGAMCLPCSDGSVSFGIILADDNNFYYTIRLTFYGEDDPFLQQTYPLILPGCFLKIMHDKLGE